MATAGGLITNVGGLDPKEMVTGAFANANPVNVPSMVESPTIEPMKAAVSTPDPLNTNITCVPDRLPVNVTTRQPVGTVPPMSAPLPATLVPD